MSVDLQGLAILTQKPKSTNGNYRFGVGCSKISGTVDSRRGRSYEVIVEDEILARKYP